MVTIKWEGPFKYEYFFNNSSDFKKFKVPGLYLWKEWDKKKQSATIAYFGKATSRTTLLGRMRQHYLLQLGLTYVVPGTRLTRDNPFWFPVFDPEYRETFYNIENTLYKENLTRVHDICKVKEIVEKGFEYAKSIDTYVGFVKHEPTNSVPENDVLKALERILLYNLKPLRTKMGTIGKPRVSYKILNVPPDILKEINDKVDEKVGPKMLKEQYP